MQGKKTGGRKKGTPNKTTKEIRLLIGKFIADNEQEFQKRLLQVDDKTFCTLYLKMIQLNLPNLKPIHYTQFEPTTLYDFEI